MPRKIISLFLTIILIVSMVIPTFSAEPSAWVKYTIEENGTKVNISWGGSPTVTRLQLTRVEDNSVFKNYTNSFPSSGEVSLYETRENKDEYSYWATIYGNNNVELDKIKFTLKSTKKPIINVEFRNGYDGQNIKSVERIKNWVNIYNLGSTDLELQYLKIRYYYTIDGEPSIVESTGNPDMGQKGVEFSDAKINPSPLFTEYPIGDREIQKQYKTNMSFTKMAKVIKNKDGLTVADYFCDTTFPSNDGKINSATYFAMLQPAFNKENLTSLETDVSKPDKYIRNYDAENDFSYNKPENIAVFYKDEQIWGPSMDAPKNLIAIAEVNEIKLNWEHPKGASKYNIYRSTSKDGPFDKKFTVPAEFDSITKKDITSYTDADIENPLISKNTGVRYFYRVSAESAFGESELSNIADATIYYFKNTDLGFISYHIIGKDNANFVLGSYIPIAFELKLNENTKTTLFRLTGEARNTDIGKVLTSKMVSNIGAATLFKGAAIKIQDGREIQLNQSSQISQIGNNITFPGNFAEGNVLKAQFVAKLSADSTAISAGIKNIYNKYYDLAFEIRGKQNSNTSNTIVNEKLPVLIVKSKLK